MLDSLVYTSRADDALTDTELELVLIRSRVLNAARGLTGALLKRGNRIAQYLEGEPDALTRTFAAIVASPLHGDVVVLARAPGVQRHFSEWHMGFVDFQQRRGRDDATAAWRMAAPNTADVDPRNTALLHLVELWREFDRASDG